MAEMDLYEKCVKCHLFIEPNLSHDPEDSDDVNTAFVHLHSGTAADEKIDESHEPKPSDQRHTLEHWKQHGPWQMQARFTDNV